MTWLSIHADETEGSEGIVEICLKCQLQWFDESSKQNVSFYLLYGSNIVRAAARSFLGLCCQGSSSEYQMHDLLYKLSENAHMRGSSIGVHRANHMYAELGQQAE